jgi:ferritin
MPNPTIPAPVLTELNRQLNHELAAAYAYHALSIWSVAENLTGFAEFFGKQAGEEREHAQKIIDHIQDRRAAPQLAPLPAPPQEFASLLDVARKAVEMEQANTRGINAVYEAAVAAKDYPAQVLMHWFINEQVEEEAWSAEMVERVRAASCAGGLSDLDRHIMRFLVKKE